MRKVLTSSRFSRTVIHVFTAVRKGHYGEQWHDRHVIETTAMVGAYACGSRLQRDPGQIGHRAEWYVNGRFCAYLSEQWSQTRWWSFQTFVNQDVWHLGCNNGAGVHVTISMDTWNYVQYGRTWFPPYGGPGVRPITRHCHCP